MYNPPKSDPLPPAHLRGDRQPPRTAETAGAARRAAPVLPFQRGGWRVAVAAAIGLIWGGTLLPPLLAQEALEVLAVGRASFAGRLVSIDGSATVVFAGDSTVARLPLPELVRWGAPREPRQGPIVYLADGSVLAAGSISSQGSDLLVSHPLLGELRLRREEVLGVLAHVPADLTRRDALANRLLRVPSEGNAPHEGEADLVLLANGDELTGQLGLVTSKQLTIDGELGPAELAWDRVTAFLFGLAQPQDFGAASELRVTAGLDDGSRLVARTLTLEADEVRLVPWSGEADAAHVFPAGRLVFLQTHGGKARYLSDLKPDSYRHVPYLSLPWNYRLDRSVTGRYLRARGMLYLKGVGMHSASRLSWRLDGRDRRFEAAAAIDDEAGPRGSVVFRVFVDSDERYRSPVVRGGEPPVPISVDVSGGRRLSLIVDFADRGDELDHADWLDARLIGDG